MAVAMPLPPSSKAMLVSRLRYSSNRYRSQLLSAHHLSWPRAHPSPRSRRACMPALEEYEANANHWRSYNAATHVVDSPVHQGPLAFNKKLYRAIAPVGSAHVSPNKLRFAVSDMSNSIVLG